MRGKGFATGSVATVFLALVLGCGGYRAASSGGRARGRATIRVKWPTASARLVPASAQSLVVTVTKGGATVGTVRVVRPDASGTLTGLPYGALDVTVRAYATPDGAGVVQAVGTGTMTVAEDASGTADVAPGSTVTALTLPGAPLALAPGGTQSLTVSAHDADGALVPLSTEAGAETLAWTVAPARVASVQGAGPSAILTGLAPGDATVTATLKVKDDGTTVSSPALALRVSEPLTTAGLARSGWPEMGGDYGASGQGHGPAAGGSVGPEIAVGSASAVATAISGPDGTVYAASEGRLVAQTASGGALWSVDETSGAISGLALNASGVLYVSTGAGLEAHRAGTGALAWSLATGAGTLSPPALGRDGTVFVFTPTTLYAVDGATGTARWSKAATLQNRLAIGRDGTLYGHSEATVTAFDPATGTTQWSKTAYKTDTQGSDLSVVDNALYLVTGVTRDASATRSAGRFDGQAGIMARENGFPLAEGGRAEGGGTGGGGGTYRTYRTYRSVVSLNTSDGSLRWAFDLPTATTTLNGRPPFYALLRSAPVVANGVVVAQTYGCVAGVDAATGAQRWIVGTPAAATATTRMVGISLAADGTAYVPRFDSTTFDGSVLQAMDPTTGSVRWSVALGGGVFGFPAVADDGAVYAGTVSGKVVPIR